MNGDNGEECFVKDFLFLQSALFGLSLPFLFSQICNEEGYADGNRSCIQYCSGLSFKLVRKIASRDLLIFRVPHKAFLNG